jgi:hypothetical protein
MVGLAGYNAGRVDYLPHVVAVTVAVMFVPVSLAGA